MKKRVPGLTVVSRHHLVWSDVLAVTVTIRYQVCKCLSIVC
jgi:hypothetical protein